MEEALRFKIVCSLSSASSLSCHLPVSGLSRLGGLVFSFYPINMAARACHRAEIETSGQPGLEGLDDQWRVLHCFFFSYKAIMLVGSVTLFFDCCLREIWGQSRWRKETVWVSERREIILKIAVSV